MGDNECVQWNPLRVEKISSVAELESGDARSAGQCLAERSTGAST